MSEQRPSLGYEQEPVSGDLAELCIAFHGVHQARQALGRDLSPDHATILSDRQAEITNEIAEFTSWRPGVLFELQKSQEESALKTLDVVALLVERSGKDAPSHYRDQQYGHIGRSALVLAGLAELRDTAIDNKQIKRGFEERAESGNYVPGVEIEIVDDKIWINGNQVKLNPTQKVIIKQILDLDGAFSYADIYETKSFRRAITEQGYRSPPVVCLTNNLQGIKAKLAKFGVPMEQLIQNDGPKGSGLLRRNPNVEVDDANLAAMTDGLVEFIFDNTDFETPFDVHEYAKQFFGTDQLGSRHLPVERVATLRLKTLANQHQMRMTETDGLFLFSDGRITVDEAIAFKHGSVARVHAKQLLHEDGSVTGLSYLQQTILELFDDNRQRGISRIHLKNQLEQRKFELKRFEVEFMQLKTLLGAALDRQQDSGRSRYHLRKNIEPLR